MIKKEESKIPSRDNTFSRPAYRNIKIKKNTDFRDMIYSPYDNRYYLFDQNTGIVRYFSADDKIPNLKDFTRCKSGSYEGFALTLSRDKKNIFLNECKKGLSVVDLRTRRKTYLFRKFPESHLRIFVELSNHRFIVISVKGDWFILHHEPRLRKILSKKKVNQDVVVLSIKCEKERDRLYAFNTLLNSVGHFYAYDVGFDSITLLKKYEFNCIGHDSFYFFEFFKFDFQELVFVITISVKGVILVFSIEDGRRIEMIHRGKSIVARILAGEKLGNKLFCSGKGDILTLELSFEMKEEKSYKKII